MICSIFNFEKKKTFLVFSFSFSLALFDSTQSTLSTERALPLLENCLFIEIFLFRIRTKMYELAIRVNIMCFRPRWTLNTQTYHVSCLVIPFNCFSKFYHTDSVVDVKVQKISPSSSLSTNNNSFNKFSCFDTWMGIFVNVLLYQLAKWIHKQKNFSFLNIDKEWKKEKTSIQRLDVLKLEKEGEEELENLSSSLEKWCAIPFQNNFRNSKEEEKNPPNNLNSSNENGKRVEISPFGNI